MPGLLSSLWMNWISLRLQSLLILPEPELKQLMDVEELENLRILRSKFIAVESVYGDVEKKKPYDKFAQFWLVQVKRITDEIEDVLDDWDNMIVKPRAVDREAQLWRSFIPSLCSCLNPTPVRKEKCLKIKEIRVKLEQMWTIADIFYTSDRSDADSVEFHIPQSRDSIIDHQPKVYGRERDKKSLLYHLLAQDGTNTARKEVKENGFKVISIVGLGGSGKTTLAQLLFQYLSVRNYFEVYAWVCVSSTCDMRRIATDLLDSLLGTPSPHTDRSEFDILQLIQHSVSGKIFLIVLDDVWVEDYSFWGPIKNSLRNGAPGSTILVTTRSGTVADQGDYKYILGPLSNSGCYSILKWLALSGTNELPRQQVKKIGRRIAEKCKGSPLVAKVVGNMLLSNDTARWEELSHSEIWELEEVAKELFRHFYLSFEGLTPQLKLCLSFCALFPKSTVINVNQLIRLWISLGFLDSGDDDKIMEMKGIECFNNLSSHSFFQELVKDSIHKNKITTCKMHDAVYDFITYMARRYGAGRDPQETSGSAVLGNGKEPRFLMISNTQVPQDLFKRLKYVRALVLSSCHLEELPSEVGNLTLLHYLDLSGNPLKQLPETVCNLFCLNFLDVNFCYLLLRLPQRIGALRQLKHLRINYTTDELHNLPQGLEELTYIRTLDVFRAGGRYKDAIKLLRDLIHLEEICIALHGEVNFEAAKLGSKTLLENLELRFVGEGRDQEKAITSMKHLKPPTNIQMLKFEDYPGHKLPKWILAINKLRRLSLRSASNISSLPALWKLSSLEFLWLYDIPNLKHLGREFFGLRKAGHFFKVSQDSDDEDEQINDLSEEDEQISEEDDQINDHSEEDEEITDQAHGDTDTEIGEAFPSLKTLRIEYLENWETWEDLDESDEDENNQISVMPSLEELIIASCPKLHLQAVPHRILGKIPSLKIEFNGQLRHTNNPTGDKSGSLRGNWISN